MLDYPATEVAATNGATSTFVDCGRAIARSLAALAVMLPAPQNGRTVGVMRELLPPGMEAALAPIERKMRASGMTVREVGADELVDGGRFQRAAFDLLLYPAGARYPAGMEGPLKRYLASGGKLVVLGAPAFSEPVQRTAAGWETWPEMRARLEQGTPAARLFDFEAPLIGWRRATNEPKSPGAISRADFGSGHGTAAQIEIVNLTGWDNWSHDVAGLPAGRNLFCFQAKGDEHTAQVAVELVERDGSRWFAVETLTTTWGFHAVGAEAFKYWADGSGGKRGGPGDRVHFENVARVGFGLAFTHTQTGGGRHQIWIDEVTLHSDPRPESKAGEELVVDAVSPGYKYFPLGKPAACRAAAGQAYLPPDDYPTGYAVASVSPRPQGTGWKKGRRTRFVPLISTYDAAGRRSGSLAWLTLDLANGSSTAVFGVSDPNFYTQPKVLGAVAELADSMLRRPWLAEAGAEHYAYFADEPAVKLGASLARETGVGFVPMAPLLVNQTVATAAGEVVAAQTFRVGENQLAEEWTWNPTEQQRAGGPYTVRTELAVGKLVLDSVSHELSFYHSKPASERAFVMARDGDFWLRGKRWAAHGVNYMPSSGIALEDGDAFENWMEARAYDPGVIEADLTRIAAAGMNSVSVFIYRRELEAGNLLDLLIRAERHGLKVNLSLRPHADPFDFNLDEVRDLITAYRLPENDTIFAYDLAWERGFGTYEPSYYNTRGRKGFDGDWKAWVIERYGSIAKAEADWGVPIPRRGAEVAGLPDSMFAADGPWRKMAAAYRRFADDLAGRAYGRAARLIREIDPRHLISFRMTIAGDPTAGPTEFPFDFRGLARALDIMEPEAYGRLGDWARVRDGAFTVAYSRYAAPGRPVMWAEYGRSVWNGSNFTANAGHRESAAWYADFLRLLSLSRSNGSSAWWFPGGFRVGENSDFGIFAPDGGDRPVTELIRSQLPALFRLAEQPHPSVDSWIEVDRDADARGIFGMYERVREPFLRLLETGRHPGLRDAGTGTTSVDTPLLAVGNTRYNGSNPPKYLNAEFDKLEVQDASGRWVDVTGGLFKRGEMTVEVAAGKPVMARAVVGNTQEATWIAPRMAAPESGSVVLRSTADSELQVAPAAISDDTRYMGTAEVKPFVLAQSVTGSARVVLQMYAWNRTWFGEKIAFTLRAAP